MNDLHLASYDYTRTYYMGGIKYYGSVKLAIILKRCFEGEIAGIDAWSRTGYGMPHTNRKTSNILIKRAYDDATPEGAYRVLVDRVWPRGRSKESLKLDQWARDLAPSANLRKWFGHDPKRWEAFQQRYLAELNADEQLERMRRLLADADGRSITLIYGAKDKEQNQAIVLRNVLSHLQNG